MQNIPSNLYDDEQIGLKMKWLRLRLILHEKSNTIIVDKKFINLIGFKKV